MLVFREKFVQQVGINFLTLLLMPSDSWVDSCCMASVSQPSRTSSMSCTGYLLLRSISKHTMDLD
ncbi:hypothetical protein HanIR_Chr16g0795471 [Helianthus annuus]|nr:hypothetical protein HanIR_Chr16g0795471 [Helianthus annuus]